ncbi:MAG: CHAT domain-containing protein [Actinomycetota bacterium]
MGVSTTADLGREAIRLAEVDPRQSAQLADVAARAARGDADPAAGSVAARAQGLAAFHLQDLDAALEFLQQAVRLARRAKMPVLSAEAQMTKAFILSWRGRPGAALRSIEHALQASSGVERARALAQRGAIRHQLGHYDKALEDYRNALAKLRRAGDTSWVARVLQNRGVGRAHRGDLSGAVSDMLESERLYGQLRAHLSLSIVHHNLGYVETLRGDIPAALRYFDQAEIGMRRVGSDVGPLLRDRSELLLSARLVREAREAALQALDACIAERRYSIVPEARLLLARAEKLSGNDHAAQLQAQRAARDLDRLGHPELAAVARVLVLTLALAGDASRVRAAELQVAAAQTKGLWPNVVLDARLAMARVALQKGSSRQARGLLASASHSRVGSKATIRAGAWHAEGLLRQSGGDLRGAQSAARAGLRILDDYAAAIGATELRAHVASHRGELAELGLRIAVGEGSARKAFYWAELGRASHLNQKASFVDDPSLGDLTAELRVVAHDINELRSAGRASAALLQRQIVLEGEIRAHTRRERSSQAGAGSRSAARFSSPAELVRAMPDVAVVEYIALDGTLFALTVVDGRARMHTLAEIGDVIGLAARLPFALHRLTRHNVSAQSRRAAADLLFSTAARLDDVMLRPLRHIADRPLLVVPTGALQWLPWSVLPSCVGRPVTVSPSASLWHTAMSATSVPGPVVVASGPALSGAHAEAAAIARVHGVAPLLDREATVAAVGSAAEGAALLHLAAHGRVRADNPQFGSLWLADGPLMIYDLERLRRPPHTVVVAACDTGRPVVPAGDELLGLTATLLSQGSAQLVASVLPVLDLHTKPLMLGLHRQLAAGERLAPALAATQETLRGSGPEGIATAAGFLCFGAGFVVPPIAPHGAAARYRRSRRPPKREF